MSRVRPHFKTHVSIKYHRKTAADVYPDNDLLALHTRLGLLAIEQYSARDGGRLRIRRAEIGALAGGKRRDKAEGLLQRLADYLELGLKLVGGLWELEWQNLNDKQGFGSKNAPGTDTPHTDTTSPPPLLGGGTSSAEHPPIELRSQSVTPPAALDWPGAPAPPRPVASLVAGHRAKLLRDDPTLVPIADLGAEEREAMRKARADFRKAHGG